MKQLDLDFSRPAVQLGIFAFVALGLLGLLDALSADRIAENQRMLLRQTLVSLLPAGSFNNDVIHDTVQIQDDRLGGPSAVTIYRARQQGKIIAALLPVVAPDGYNGKIHLLIAVQPDGVLAGVRVLEHHETPGLGDPIESVKSGWIRQFMGRSLTNPEEAGWRVKRDGGVFDQLAGATITPRAVVGAVHRALQVIRDRHELLFNQDSATDPVSPKPKAERP
jgi:electron transport complex protein RnfG